jgi:hypothetical protein
LRSTHVDSDPGVDVAGASVHRPSPRRKAGDGPSSRTIAPSRAAHLDLLPLCIPRARAGCLHFRSPPHPLTPALVMRPGHRYMRQHACTSDRLGSTLLSEHPVHRRLHWHVARPGATGLLLRALKFMLLLGNPIPHALKLAELLCARQLGHSKRSCLLYSRSWETRCTHHGLAFAPIIFTASGGIKSSNFGDCSGIYTGSESRMATLRRA